MKIKNYLIAAVALFAMCLLAPEVKATEILTPNFLGGSNMVINATSTNTYGTTNIYTVAGVATTNTSAMRRLTLQKNPDGSNPSYAIGVTLIGTNVTTGTNIVTFSFKGVPITGGRASTSSQNLFSFGVTGNGTNAVVIATNVPAATFQGCKQIEFSTSATTGSGSGLYIEAVNLLGGM